MPLVVAVVPIKRLEEAKSRLGDLLSPDERLALVVGLLRSVLGALAGSGVVRRRIVISPDPAALAVARAAGAATLLQRDTGLNPALEAARAASPPGAALLVTPADLPLLRPEDVRRALALVDGRPAAVIAPDREERGTNLLLLAPPGGLAFQFGPESFDRHLAAARAAGRAVAVYRAPGVAFDLDTPDDLDELRRRGWPPFGELLPGVPETTGPVPARLVGSE